MRLERLVELKNLEIEKMYNNNNNNNNKANSLLVYYIILEVLK